MAENPHNYPPYRRIAEEIISRINSGELQPGDPLPSVREIMRQEGISSATASRVPAYLRTEGYAVATPGVGTIVATPKKLTAGADRLSRLRAGGLSMSEDERVEGIEARMEPASQEVADALGLEPGDDVIRRRRRYVDSAGVVSVSTTWISGALADAAPELLGTEPLPSMTFGLIEERTGRRASRRRDTVALRPAPEDIAVHLGIDAGAPAITMINHYWDQGGEPTEYAVDYYGSTRELTSEYDLN